MNTRQLGKDGYRIDEVGLGCWQFGGDFGDMKDETAISIMATAVENGVNFFDTANVYGAGRSEDLIGRFVKECPSPITVATKFGRGDDVYPNNYSEDTVRSSVEGSLKRLGVDRLDLLQLHCIPAEVLRKGAVFDWLRQLKQEGLIKAILPDGISMVQLALRKDLCRIESQAAGRLARIFSFPENEKYDCLYFNSLRYTDEIELEAGWLTLPLRCLI